VIDCFNSLQAIGLSETNWAPIQARIKIDYKTKATTASILAKFETFEAGSR
jgi:hypothetical protein